MFSKIFSIIIVLVFVAQDLDARTTYNATTRISNEKTFQTLNDLLNKIHKSVENIEFIIHDFEDNVKLNLGNINLPHIIADLEKDLEEIAEKSETSFAIVIKCLTNVQGTLRDIEYVANKGVEICLTQSDETKNQVTKKLTEISVKAAISISNISGGIMNCFNLSAEDVNVCLASLVEPSEKEANIVLAEIESTIEDSQKIVDEANQALSGCVVKVQKEIINIENVILDKFQNCVKA